MENLFEPFSTMGNEINFLLKQRWESSVTNDSKVLGIKSTYTYFFITYYLHPLIRLHPYMLHSNKINSCVGQNMHLWITEKKESHNNFRDIYLWNNVLEPYRLIAHE